MDSRRLVCAGDVHKVLDDVTIRHACSFDCKLKADNKAKGHTKV